MSNDNYRFFEQCLDEISNLNRQALHKADQQIKALRNRQRQLNRELTDLFNTEWRSGMTTRRTLMLHALGEGSVISRDTTYYRKVNNSHTDPIWNRPEGAVTLTAITDKDHVTLEKGVPL